MSRAALEITKVRCAVCPGFLSRERVKYGSKTCCARCTQVFNENNAMALARKANDDLGIEPWVSYARRRFGKCF